MSHIDEWWEILRDRVAAHALTQKLWTRYEAAAPREQLALRVLGGFLAALLVLLLVVLPLHRFNSDAIAAYRAQQDTLTWMQSNRALIGSSSSGAARKPGDSVLTLANQSARNLGLSFKRYEPNGERGLNLWLEQVPFDQVVKWLDVLERDYGVIAVDFSASRRNEAGLVDVRLILQG